MKWHLWLGLIAFCLLSSAGWLFPPLASDSSLPFESPAFLFGVLGVAGLVLLLGRWRRGLPWYSLTLAGLGFFGLPTAFFEWSGGGLSGISRSIGFAMTPVVVILVVAFTGRDEVRRLLLPALCGVGGVLLLLPFTLPASTRGWWMLGGLLAVIVLMAAASVWMNRILQPFRLTEAVAIVGLSNAAFLILCASFSGPAIGRWSALAAYISLSSVANAAETILILWLLREIAPVRLAARYLVIPLLIVAEGYLIFRPELTLRMGLGAALLAGGAAVLLFSSEASEKAHLSLR